MSDCHNWPTQCSYATVVVHVYSLPHMTPMHCFYTLLLHLVANAKLDCRDSKLTRILEDSIGGNCKTTMMAMISPALEAYSGQTFMCMLPMSPQPHPLPIVPLQSCQGLVSLILPDVSCECTAPLSFVHADAHAYTVIIICVHDFLAGSHRLSMLTKEMQEWVQAWLVTEHNLCIAAVLDCPVKLLAAGLHADLRWPSHR